MDFQEFIKDPKVPDWIQTHPIFKEVKSSNKIFTSIGLHNFSEEISMDVDDSCYQVVKNLITAMWGQLENAHYYLNNAATKIINGRAEIISKHKNLPILHILKQFYPQFEQQNAKKFVNQQRTSNKLYLLKDITDIDNKIFAKKGEGLFKVYNKIVALLNDNVYKLISLDKLSQFKEYSAANFSGKMHIVFSAEGKEGAWDLLTMSMRGISSCQSWHGQFRNATIGSMLDPFTGIIYLTSGTKVGNYGSKMLRRCIVRFVINSITRQPAIYLEWMYPSYNQSALKAFKDIIQTKLGKKFPIIDWKMSGLNKFYVPYSESTKALLKFSQDPKCANTPNKFNQMTILPYRDTFIEYRIKEDPKVFCGTQIETSLSNLQTCLSNIVNKALKIPAATAALLIKTFDNYVISPIDKTSFTDHKAYMRKVYMRYFTHKKQFIEGLQKELDLNAKKAIKQAPVPAIKKLKKSKTTKKSEPLFSIEKEIMPLIDKEIKAQWQSLFTSTKKITKVSANAKN